MTDQDHTIFRERAIEKYKQRQYQHTVLHLSYPPVMLFLWPLLLFLMFSTFLFVCSIQVPIEVAGTAMVVENGGKPHQTNPQIVVLLILPSEQQVNVHRGQAARFCLGQPDRCINISIDTEITQVMSPKVIWDQYQLPPPLALTITKPSKVAIAHLEPTSLGPVYLGSQGYVNIQTGSESVLSPTFNHLITI